MKLHFYVALTGLTFTLFSCMVGCGASEVQEVVESVNENSTSSDERDLDKHVELDPQIRARKNVAPDYVKMPINSSFNMCDFVTYDLKSYTLDGLTLEDAVHEQRKWQHFSDKDVLGNGVNVDVCLDFEEYYFNDKNLLDEDVEEAVEIWLTGKLIDNGKSDNYYVRPSGLMLCDEGEWIYKKKPVDNNWVRFDIDNVIHVTEDKTLIIKNYDVDGKMFECECPSTSLVIDVDYVSDSGDNGYASCVYDTETKKVVFEF